MDKKALLRQAQTAAKEASCPPGKLFLIQVAIALGASLLVTLMNFLLSRQVDTAQGLTGMQTRAMLGTVQSGLSYVLMFAVPVWEIGAVYAAMQICRGQDAGVKSLLQGFRQFWQMLRLILLEAVVYGVAAVACTYVGMIIYISLPMADALTPYITQMGTSAQIEALIADEAFMHTLLSAAGGLLVIVGILLAAVCIYVSYTLRLMRYAALDDWKLGACRALKLSAKWTKGCKMELFKLDLHFWAYYTLRVFTVLLAFTPEFLHFAGIRLPMDAQLAFWLFYAAYVAGQLTLGAFLRPKLELTFAGAYDTLAGKSEGTTEA